MVNAPARYLSDLASGTGELVRKDAVVYLVVLVYTIAGLLLLDLAGARDRASYSVYVQKWMTLFLFLMPVVMLLLQALWVVHRFSRRRALAFRRMYSARRIAHLLSGMTLLMGLMVFQGTFTSIKNVLPVLHGDSFPFDRVQADIDAALHFGVDPWRLLLTLGENDVLRRGLEWK